MVHLTLTDDERDLLENTLATCITDLRTEIRDTDRIEFKNSLKQREAMYKQLLVTLQATHETANA